MNKKVLISLASLLLAGLAVAGQTGLIGSRALRVGVILPLTGPNAAIGLGMRNAIRLAAFEVNARGGIQGRKVELVELDDASLPEKAADAAKRLAEDQRVVAALVHYDHDCSAASKNILREAGLPNLVAGVSNRELPESVNNSVEFRLLPFGTTQMSQAAKYAWQVLGARKFLYVREETGFGMSMVNQLRAGLTPLVGKVVSGGDLSIRAGDTDFGQVVAQVLAESPDYVMYGGQPREAGLLLQKLRAAGFSGWFESATHYPSQELIDLAQDKAEGALQVFPGLPPETSPAGKAFLDAYAAHGFQEPPSIYGIHAYAETQALLGAMDKSLLTRPSIVGALGHEQVATALGPIRFNLFGSSFQTAVIYQVIKGRWTPIYATDKANKLQPYPRM